MRTETLRTRLLLPLLCIAAVSGRVDAANVVPGNVAIEFQAVATRSAVGGFFTPIDMHHPDDGALYFADITGRIIKHSSGTPSVFLNLTTHSDVPFTSNFAGGLLGIAFHPGYGDSESPGYRKFYTFSTDLKTVNQTTNAATVTPGNQLTGLPDFWHPEMYAPANSGNPLTNWTNPDSPDGGNTDFDHFNVIREWTATADGAAVDTGVSPRVVLRMAHGFFNKGSHNAGSMRFGPDGNLYISTGDGGGNSGQDHDGGINNSEDGHTDGIGNGQDLTVIYGKVLRIDPTATVKNSSNGQYGVPSDNPYVLDDSNPDYLDEIYANGFRNPWKLNFDSRPGGNHALYLSEVGQHHREEINIITAGGNYGWGYMEGNVRLVGETNYSGAPNPADAIYGTWGTPVRVPPGGFDNFESVPPLVDYLTRRQYAPEGAPDISANLVGDGTAVTGGFVYRGSAIPELYGMYVFGDYSTGGGSRPPPPGLPANRGRIFYFDPILDGDFNGDGNVDAADYTVWRNNLGAEVHLPNDRTSGTVDESDYMRWKANYSGVPMAEIQEFVVNYNSSLWGQLLGFGEDADGEIYALLDNGNVLKLLPAVSAGVDGLVNLPEPGTYCLLGLAIAFLAASRNGRLYGGSRK